MNFGIIAAGEGSRLVSEGVASPKPLVKLEGKPMIGRLIEIFVSMGAGRICVIVNEQMTDVADYLRSLAPTLPCPLELEIHTTPSSMHSFHFIGERLRHHGRFIVTTVDTIFRPEEFRKYVNAYENAPANVDGMMAVTRFVDDEKPLYVAEKEGRITAFLDSPREDAHFVSGGIYGLADKAVDVLDQCLHRGVSRMRNYQRALIDAGLDIEAFDMGKIIDVDHADDIVVAENFLSETND